MLDAARVVVGSGDHAVTQPGDRRPRRSGGDAEHPRRPRRPSTAALAATPQRSLGTAASRRTGTPLHAARTRRTAKVVCPVHRRRMASAAAFSIRWGPSESCSRTSHAAVAALPSGDGTPRRARHSGAEPSRSRPLLFHVAGHALRGIPIGDPGLGRGDSRSGRSSAAPPVVPHRAGLGADLCGLLFAPPAGQLAA